MSFRLSIVCNARRLFRNEICTFCRYQSFQHVRRYAVQYRANPKKSPQEVRFDIDRRNRHALYRMLVADGLIQVKPSEADEIVTKFIANEENNIEPAANVRQLAAQHKIRVVNIAYLAVPLLRVPDIKDSKLQLPPSQQATLSASILRACSAAEDLTSTLQILNAVYYSSNGYDLPQALDIARHFTTNEIADCKRMLATLAGRGDAYAMTLHGRFLEKLGNMHEAQDLYEKALDKFDVKMHKGYPHPMALPWMTPWMALLDLQTSTQNPELNSKVTRALEFGAYKADDPTAFYRLAAFQESGSYKWLECMNKAAASGHSGAMYQLGLFNMDMHAKLPVTLADRKLRKVFHFLTTYKHRDPLALAKEWFNAAANGGHKPSLLQLADMCDGDKEKERTYLRAMLDEPQKGKKEQWPQLVMLARRRIAQL